MSGERSILLVLLQAPLAFVARTEERAEAADAVPLGEGENFDTKPTGTSIVNAAMYQDGQALDLLNVFRGV